MMALHSPATTSTDLFDGPQYRTCGGMLFPPSADLPDMPWFHLANKYANRTPVTLFPVPVEKNHYFVYENIEFKNFVNLNLNKHENLVVLGLGQNDC